MRAKSKNTVPVNAFSGREYVHYEWRPVPAGCEDEATRNPFLEIDGGTPEPEPERIDATDAAIELAEENGINLGSVAGTGSGGRILVSDVRALLEE